MLHRLLLVFILLGAPAHAQAWEVFVNNKPFKGQVIGGPSDLLLQAEPLDQMLELDLAIDENGVSLDGQVVPSETREGAVFVNARKLTELSGGRLVVNKELSSIDVYILGSKKTGAQGGEGANTYLIVKSLPGDPVGQGVEWKLFDNCRFTLSSGYYNKSSVNVSVDTPDGHNWRLTFGVPENQGPLKPGFYHASGSYGGAFASMSVSADSRFADGYGTFEVLDIAFARDRPTRLAVDFVVHERGKPEKRKLTGKLRYKTSVP
ncbi:MAG: hypothetical protein HY319_32820 [Armatimonadetes bacterium]|nr:hypothetical protein [Armatimonadota bacterium]